MRQAVEQATGELQAHSCTSLKRSAFGSSLRLSALHVRKHAQHAGELPHLSRRKGPRRDRSGWWKRGRDALWRAPTSARCLPTVHPPGYKRTGELALPERLRDVVQQADAVCDLHLPRVPGHVSAGARGCGASACAAPGR